MKYKNSLLTFSLFFILLLTQCVQREVCDDCEINSISDMEFEDIKIGAPNGTFIRENDTTSLSKNFRASDFFIQNKDTVTQFYLACEFVDVAEYLHDWTQKFNKLYGLDVSVRFTSTFRSRFHNKKIGGAKNSLHTVGKAVDFQFTKANKLIIHLFHLDYIRNGELRNQIERKGISSFIFYETHIHLAIRGSSYFEDKRSDCLKNIYQ